MRLGSGKCHPPSKLELRVKASTIGQATIEAPGFAWPISLQNQPGACSRAALQVRVKVHPHTPNTKKTPLATLGCIFPHCTCNCSSILSPWTTGYLVAPSFTTKIPHSFCHRFQFVISPKRQLKSCVKIVLNKFFVLCMILPLFQHDLKTCEL